MKTEENNIDAESFQARFHGEIYDVRPTKVITKHVNHHWDFNGYEVDPHTVNSQQWGMFLNGDQKYTVKKFNGNYQVYNGSYRIGSISPMYIP